MVFEKVWLPPPLQPVAQVGVEDHGHVAHQDPPQGGQLQAQAFAPQQPLSLRSAQLLELGGEGRLGIQAS